MQTDSQVNCNSLAKMTDAMSQRSAVTSAALSDVSDRKSRSDVISRSSGRATFPSSAQSRSSRKPTSTTGEKEVDQTHVNPFKMPNDNDIFTLRSKERNRKEQERIRQKTLKIQDKTTQLPRINFRMADRMHSDVSDQPDGQCAEIDKFMTEKSDQQFVMAITKDRNVDRETLNDYISKKREMFLVQYSLGVKREEMKKLEEIAAAEERKLELAEQYLEEDAIMFDEFLKENDKNSVEAIKIAEAETKAKLEKVAEIKRINAQITVIRSEISKYEDTLKEYQMYRRFIETLTPKVWLEERNQEKQKRKEEKQREKELQSSQSKNRQGSTAASSSDKSDAKQTKAKRNKSAATSKSGQSRAKANTDEGESSRSWTDTDDDSDEELEIYFTHPQQLLDIFAELEEQNLSLIQNSQETEETLEEMKQTIKNTRNKMEKETNVLKDQIDKLNKAIAKEEEKASELETKARMFSYGEFKAEDQEKMLEVLNEKVEDVYRSCIGENDANLSTLQMLTTIENRLEELFQQIELMPPDKVEMAEKAKEKERRQRMREEKLEQQKAHQEDRIKKALERANAEPKKKTGRRLVARSEPPQLKRREADRADRATQEEEELAYYFAP